MAHIWTFGATFGGSGIPDFWNVTWDVYPTVRGVTTDVLLVQALLVAYFMAPAGVNPGLKAKAFAIITRLGKRFDVWNMTMLSPALGSTKMETGRRALQPLLFAEMYGGAGP